MTQIKKLNIGCGTDIRKGYINLDSMAIPGVDVVHDIEKTPLPFPDNEFDEILCQDVLEHVEYLPILKDLHRILKTGGKLNIRVPHFTSKNNYIDPTHRKLFSINTFDFFIKNSKRREERKYYFDFCFDHIASSLITFRRKPFIVIYNRLVSPIVNHNQYMKELYETTGMSRLFPAENILITLIK